jgi:hypothetical protein
MIKAILEEESTLFVTQIARSSAVQMGDAAAVERNGIVL